MVQRKFRTVAVVIVARNAAKTISWTLDSLIYQTVAPDEIIVIDDGSQDNTWGVVDAYKKQLPMLLLKRISHKGIARARNIGNSLVKSEYISVLDADDFFAPEAIAQYKKKLDMSQRYDFIYANWYYLFHKRKIYILRQAPAFKSYALLKTYALCSLVCPFKHSAIVYRKAVFDIVGGYDETLSMKIDNNLVLRFIANRVSIGNLDYGIAFHYKHFSQWSMHRLSGLKIYIHLILKYEQNIVLRFAYSACRVLIEFLKLLLRS